MPAVDGFVTSIQTKLYHHNAYLTSTVDFDAVDALATAANEVQHTREISDLSQSENTFTFPEFGKDAQTSVAGPSTRDSMSFTFAVDHADAKHAALLGASVGDPIVLVIKSEKTSPAGESAYYIRGTIASNSVSNPSGDVRQATVAVSIDTKPALVHSS